MKGFGDRMIVKCTFKEGETVSRWREPERNLNWKRDVEMEKIEVLEESRVRASLSRWLHLLDIAPHLQCSAAQGKFHHASQIFPMTPFFLSLKHFHPISPGFVILLAWWGIRVEEMHKDFHLFIPLRSSLYRTAGPPVSILLCIAWHKSLWPQLQSTLFLHWTRRFSGISNR